MAIHCQITMQNYCTMGLIEGFSDEPSVASSLNQPRLKRQVIIHCINTTEQPLTFWSGATIGTYTGVDTTQVEEIDSLLYEARPTSANEVPVHLEELFQSARPHCEGASQTARLASLLSRYATVFSTGDDDVGRTSEVERSIPLKEGAHPIRQPPTPARAGKGGRGRKAGPEPTQEGVIEPAGGAWSLPMVLVQKKDGKWRFYIDYR
ncbi:uncharacterized protein [Watersipora subatra]|uniref:uncharacterized protein n=1 Tax=Watersipora subatra TaxID=2589382 RepID=UPI00355B0504